MDIHYLDMILYKIMVKFKKVCYYYYGDSMLENISKEIFFYSVVPVAIISLIIIILLIIDKKKSNNYYKFDYVIKILIAILIGFVLSIMTGYTVWVIKRLIDLETISDNILNIALLGVIDISLLSSLIIMFIKVYKSVDSNEESKK